MRTRTTLVGVAVAALAFGALATVAFNNSGDADADLVSSDAGRVVSASLDGGSTGESSAVGDFDCAQVDRDSISGKVISADDCVYQGENALPADPTKKTAVVVDSLKDSLGVGDEDVQLQPIGAIESSGVTHATFRQYYKGLRVLRSRISIHVTTEDDNITYLSNGALVDIDVPSVDADISEEDARQTALQSIGSDGETWGDTITELAIYPAGQRAGVLAWRVVVPATKPMGQWEVIVDASSGIVIESLNSIRTLVNGTGNVFDPNPIVSSNNDSLTDNSDGDYAELNNQRRLRNFMDLDEDLSIPVGSIAECADSSPQKRQPLKGKWASLVDGEAEECLGDAPYDPPGGDPPKAEDPTYNYSRGDDRFEEANAYFHITETGRYLSSLGNGGIYNFESFRPSVNVFTRAELGCYACYVPPVAESSFNGIPACTPGSDINDAILLDSLPGVDAAEDGDVVVHEYGHAVQNAILNKGVLNCEDSDTFISGESRAIGEAFGDYLAYTMHSETDDAAGPFGRECIGAWVASTGLFGDQDCTRTLTDNLDYPGDMVWEEHDDSLVWSRALYDLAENIGRSEADPMIVASNFYLEPYSTFSDGLRAIIQAAEDQGRQVHIPAIISAFADRGIHPAPTVTDPTSGSTLDAGVMAGITWDTLGASALSYQVEYTEDNTEVGTWTQNMDSGLIHPTHFSNGEPVAIYFDRPAWRTSARWSKSGQFSFRSASQSETNQWAKMGNSKLSQFSAVTFLETRGGVEFDYKVSSEKGKGGKLGDSLFFVACGLTNTEQDSCTQLGSWSGDKEGHFSVSDLSEGTWTFYWRYAKDGSVSSGADGAFVDNIEISGVASPQWTGLGTTGVGASMIDWINPVAPSTTYQARVRGIAGATTTPWAYGPTFEVVLP